MVRYAERVKARPDRSLVGFLSEDRAEAAKEQAAAELTLSGRQKLVLAITAFSFALVVFSVIPWDSIIGFEATDPVTTRRSRTTTGGTSAGGPGAERAVQ